MKIKDDLIILDSGRTEYANRGIIGIDGDFELFYGYDGGLYIEDWTYDEKTELAEYMIDLWQRYRNNIK